MNDLCTESNVVTASVNDELKIRKISRELFLTTLGQKINSEMKKSVSDWQDLREKLKKTIADKLKLIFIKNAQEEKMICSHNEVNMVIVNYSEIGRSWKFDGSESNQAKVFQVTKNRFRKDNGYELRMEKSVMNEHNLSYIDELDESKAKLSKGCIVRMVTRRKVEMVSYF